MSVQLYFWCILWVHGKALIEVKKPWWAEIYGSNAFDHDECMNWLLDCIALFKVSDVMCT